MMADSLLDILKAPMATANAAAPRRAAVMADLGAQQAAWAKATQFAGPHRRQRALEALAAARAQLADIDREVDGNVRSLRAAIAAARSKRPVLAGDELQRALLLATETNAHVETLRQQFASGIGSVRPFDYAGYVQAARESGDLARLRAVEIVLPEFQAAAAGFQMRERDTRPYAADTARALSAVEQELPDALDVFKSQQEREMEFAEVALDQLVATEEGSRREAAQALAGHEHEQSLRFVAGEAAAPRLGWTIQGIGYREVGSEDDAPAAIAPSGVGAALRQADAAMPSGTV
jgi:hypothetical protein